MVLLQWCQNPEAGHADPGPGQPGKELARMVTELAAAQREQEAVSCCQHEELQECIERQMQRIENLAARLAATIAPPPAQHTSPTYFKFMALLLL